MRRVLFGWAFCTAIISQIVMLQIAWAQEERPSLSTMAHAAGYKALFSCGAVFDGGRSLDQAQQGELARIYPDYRTALSRLSDPVIDRERKTSAVAFSDHMPPRMAAWRAHFGCTLLPIGGETGLIDDLPALPEQRSEAQADGLGGMAEDGRFEPVLTAAFDKETYGPGTQTTAVVIADTDGFLTERYRDDFGPDTAQRTWSVAKSLSATLIGAALHEGRVTLDMPAGLPEWSDPSDPRQAITLVHLLHMASGLDAGPRGSRTDEIYFGGARVIDHAGRGSLLAPPGTRWFYANNDTLLAMRVLRQTFDSDQAYWSWVHNVMVRLGMKNTTLGVDWGGDYISSSQIWTTARDLTRIGRLYLQDGIWNGERLLAEGWADYVAAPAPAQPPLARQDGSLLPGYGAQFWLFGSRHGLPDGTYAAMGHRGQYIVIIPERKIVIVRRGFDESGGTRFDIAAFAADILTAMDTP